MDDRRPMEESVGPQDHATHRERRPACLSLLGRDGVGEEFEVVTEHVRGSIRVMRD